MPSILQDWAGNRKRILCLYLEPSMVARVPFPYPDPVTGQRKSVLLTGFQGLNDPDRPITSLAGKARRDAAMLRAAERIMSVLDENQ